MIRSLALAALLVTLLTPGIAGAVVTTFKVTDVGTGETIASGTLVLTGPAEQTQTTTPGGQVDLVPGNYRGTFYGPNSVSTPFDCAVGPSPTSCGFPVTPAAPFMLQTPPFGGLSFSPVYFGFHVDNLPANFRQLTDVTPVGTFVIRQTRQGLGDTNNSEDFPLNVHFFGVDAALGGPQLSLGIVQLNIGLHGLLGGAEVRSQIVSRADNQQSNRSSTGSGIAGGFGAELVLSLPGGPAIVRDLAVRLVSQFLYGHVRGSSSRIELGELGTFGFSPAESADLRGSFSAITLGGDLLFMFLDRHVDVYVGARWREIATTMQLTREGTVPGLGHVTRISRIRTRGDQVFFPVGAEVRIGDWFSPLAPVMARLELQPGPDSFGVFFKVGYVLGTGGSPNPGDIVRRFFQR